MNAFEWIFLGMPWEIAVCVWGAVLAVGVIGAIANLGRGNKS